MIILKNIITLEIKILLLIIVVCNLVTSNVLSAKEDKDTTLNVLDKNNNIEEPPNLDLNELSSHVIYPEIARRAGIEGTVYVMCLINDNDKIIKAFIKYSDSELLNQAALDAVCLCKSWESCRQFGEKIKCWISVPIEFRLTDDYDTNSDSNVSKWSGYNRNDVQTYKGDTVFIRMDSFDKIDKEDIKLDANEFVFFDKEVQYDYKNFLYNMEYPEVAISNNISGTVYVNCLIGRNSKILAAYVSSSDQLILNTYALKAVASIKKWEAAVFEGEKIASWISIPVMYSSLDSIVELSFYDKDEVQNNPYLLATIDRLNAKFASKVISVYDKKQSELEYEIQIDENGRTTDVKLISSSNDNLNKYITNIIKTHKFIPYVYSSGKRAKALLKIPIIFGAK